MSWFLDLRLTAKLLGSFAVVLVIMLAVGGFSLVQMGTINASSTEIAESWLPSVERSSAMATTSANVRIAQFRHVLTPTAEGMEQAERDIASRLALLDSLKTAYRPLITSPEEQQAFDSYERSWRSYMANWDSIQVDSRASRTEEARTAMSASSRRLYDAALADLGRIVELNSAGGKTASDNATLLFSRTRVTAIAVLCLAVMLGMSLAWFVARLIVRPVSVLSRNAEAMSRGELDMESMVATKDEVGQLQLAFTRMADAQRAMTRAATAIAAGDLSSTVTARGSKDELGQAFVALHGTLSGMLNETGTLVRAAKAGSLATRGDASRFRGAYRDLVQGINETLSAVVAPVDDAAVVLGRLADRDLTARVTAQYAGDFARMKDSINTAAATLENAMRQVSTAAEQTASAGQQIAAGSQALAQGSSEQAASLEEVSSSLQELNASAASTAQNAREARKMAEAARAAVQHGSARMQRMSEAMEQIKSSSDETAKIVRTINEIAFQTNLLALNAAVEAARAGDAGRGFAVVADEVRTLAIRCAEAARNTTSLIEKSVSTTDEGVSLNGEVTTQLVQIERDVSRVSDVVRDIATAGEQQRDGVQQINQAVHELNSVTQQVAANAEEAASASEELASQSQSLQDLVGGFRVDMAGDAPAGASMSRRRTRLAA